MPIRREDTEFFQDELKIKAEQVFLEKADQPSSEYGDGIPWGLLLLTNKRLFFFNMGTGSTNPDESKGIDRIFKTIDRMFPDQFDTAIKYGISKFLDKGEKIDIDPYLDKEYSFVIPIEQIVSCKKFGNPHFFKPFTTNKNLKKRYTRIGILNSARIGILNSAGVKTNYCIYINKPIDPESIHYIVRYDKWFDTIISEVAKIRQV